MAFLDTFFSWPLWGRAALVLAAIWLVLLLVCVPFLKLLSLVPFLLKWIFRAVYLLLEWLASLLHKFLGGMFYHVDNGLAAVGQRVDGWLVCWQRSWNSAKACNSYAALLTIAALVCYLCVILPPMLHMEEGGWRARGWLAYLQAEDAFAEWIAEQDWYVSSTLDSPPIDEPEPPQNSVQMSLTVYRVPSVLAIRDIPSTVGCTTLDKLSNGSVVSWYGELAFGFAEGQQEAWVKVTTDSGIEGWGRLNYLHPEEDIGVSLVVTNVSDIVSSASPAE